MITICKLIVSTICKQGISFPMYKIINKQYAFMWGEVIGIQFNPTVETGYMSQLDVE